MPIAGGILVAGSAARCLSSAAGMLRFLARLSGRRRHVRRSCGPGGGCCRTVQTGETTAVSATASVVVAGEVLAGTTTMTTTTTTTSSQTSVDQDRHQEWKDSISRIHDSRWIDESYARSSVSCKEHERLLVAREDQQDRMQARQVHHLRQERCRTSFSENEEATNSSVHPHHQECSRLSANGDNENYTRNESSRISIDAEQNRQNIQELRKNSRRLSTNNFDDCKLHRVEEIQENQRLSRRYRSHRTSRCCSSSMSTSSTRQETSRKVSNSEWTSNSDYVDLIVRGHHHVDDEPRQRISSTIEHERDLNRSTFCNSSTRRRRIPPYLATLLIISYTLLGIADACSSRSTPKPRPPTPTPRPNITFHMYTCPQDYAEWYCLNGATCFTVKIQESLLYNCLCANGFIGQRCEFKDLDGSYLPSRQRVMLETASIAGGATIAVFLVVIICIAAYIHCKRKQKELRTSSTCVDTVDGPGRDPELRPFSNRSRSLMILMAKNPNGSTMCPSIEQTRMPGWNDYSQMESARMASVNEGKHAASSQ